jgi:hypothetical protein
MWQSRVDQLQERLLADRLWVAAQLLRPLNLMAQAQDSQEQQQAFQSVETLPQLQWQQLPQLRQPQPQRQILRVVQLGLCLIKAQPQQLQCLELAQRVRF